MTIQLYKRLKRMSKIKKIFDIKDENKPFNINFKGFKLNI
jgi:hypothetical protein